MERSIKILTLSLLAVLLLVAVLPLCAFAEETTVVSFDETSVLQDLQGATVLNEEFNLDNYPLNENGTPQLLAFTEFAFSLMHEYQQYYGLYLYVYYPQGNLGDYEQNNVEMAVTYDSNNEPTAWHKFHVKLLSSDGNGVLYKFKIVDTDSYTVGSIFNRVGQTPSERRYDINSIELRENDKTTASDYGIGGTWTFTGYSKGMHSSSMEESTLQSEATYVDTLKLDVHQTYYRTWRDGDNSLADQLSSVYFAVPTDVDEGFDRLYAIDFDAYKYLSSPMFMIYDKSSFVLDYDEIYHQLLEQRGIDTSLHHSDISDYKWLRWGYILLETYSEDTDCWYGFPNNDLLLSVDPNGSNYLKFCSWVFQVSKDDDYKISRDALLNYMDTFSATFGREIRGKYSDYLFASHYYTSLLDFQEVTNGENIGCTITCDDLGELRGSFSKHTFWQSLSLLFNFSAEDTVTEFCPIQKVNYADIVNLSNEEIATTYFIAEEDVPEFKVYLKLQNDQNNTVYLFRFDVDTYYSDALSLYYKNVCGYVAQEPIYLDFDIISLTYDRNGVKTVIPVVSDPIDHIASVEPGVVDMDLGDMFSDLLTTLLTVMFGIVAIVAFGAIFLGFLKYLFKR